MDPTTALVAFVSLLADFEATRRSDKAATVEEFKSWLNDNRHEELLRLLNQTVVSTLGAKAQIQEFKSEVLLQLRALQEKLDGGTALTLRIGDVGRETTNSESPSTEAEETLSLDKDNHFVGGAGAIEELATRCAIRAISGVATEFNISLEPLVFDVAPSDPFFLPTYEARRGKQAQLLKSRLQILVRPELQDWWRFWLATPREWFLAFGSLIEHAAFKRSQSGVAKIDVWRTEEPRISAPIYLDEAEMSALLRHLGFESPHYLAFGPHWRCASDMPVELIAKHVIPSVVMALAREPQLPAPEVLNLMTWHIGLG